MHGLGWRPRSPQSNSQLSKTTTDASGFKDLTVYLGAVELHYTAASPNASVTSYYLFGGQRVAMNKDGTLTYLHGDHLGSASMATDGSGAMINEGAFKPFGEPLGSSTFANDKTYTGQRVDSATGGLMDYNARFYSPVLGRFISADSIVPGAGNPQALNRYAYVFNNPLKFVDPSGHDPRGDNGNCNYGGDMYCGQQKPSIQNQVIPAKIKPDYLKSAKQRVLEKTLNTIGMAPFVLMLGSAIGTASLARAGKAYGGAGAIGVSSEIAGQVVERLVASNGDIWWTLDTLDFTSAIHSGNSNRLADIAVGMMDTTSIGRLGRLALLGPRLFAAGTTSGLYMSAASAMSGGDAYDSAQAHNDGNGGQTINQAVNDIPALLVNYGETTELGIDLFSNFGLRINTALSVDNLNKYRSTYSVYQSQQFANQFNDANVP